MASQNKFLNLRSGNWTEVMDSAMLNLITEEHVLGNFVNGSFTPLSWIRIVHDFNARTKVNFAKSHLQNRLKVLKRQFVMYQTLASKSGWGWDYDRNISTAGNPNDWDAVVAENPVYSRCRDKPFPAYQDIAFLSGKNHCHGSNDALSYSPTPTPVKSGNPNTSIASADTTSSKRRRSSPPSCKTTPTSTRRGKLECNTNAIQELVNLDCWQHVQMFCRCFGDDVRKDL
uniref:Myb/SANT-like domain-containing protein n=1 Tax=Ananas comosus var. bracteatus TaxID=296719 RepID=A0A6V7PEQ5_ANACO|nr:unnamed protein product [Ananas comosus var. bracteatus]